MPEFLTYKDQKVTVLHKTHRPDQLTALAIKLTQKKLTDFNCDDASNALLKFILDADHLSVSEHNSITFYIENVSRSFLAQLTRHRIGSFTSASQHYQDYRDYPMIIDPTLTEDQRIDMCISLQESLRHYAYLVDINELAPQEARQCLPNASAVAIIWTVNIRSLVNFFIQRLCHRNTSEMIYFARQVYAHVLPWSAIFRYVGPPCFRDKCNQGKMSCGNIWPSQDDMADLANYGVDIT